MIQAERIRKLNAKEYNKEGSYVLYRMQASQRASYNHALEFAVLKANELKLPVHTVFGITPSYSGAALRHYIFMLEGLKETAENLGKRGISFSLHKGEPFEQAVKLLKNAAAVVVDRGYTRIQREWREKAAEKTNCAFYMVESDVIVPVETASPKEEYSAATIRKKIKKLLPEFIAPFESTGVIKKSRLKIKGDLNVNDRLRILKDIKIDELPGKTSYFKGGEKEAKKRLKMFMDEKLGEYGEKSSDPSLECVSYMSPYIHFGQISPLYITEQVLRAGQRVSERYLEELIIRRELAVNFVFYNKDYDSIKCLPGWAAKTLKEHSGDKREYKYSPEQLENAETHDVYWNAAQNQMRQTGHMHGYMRMYWGKKVIEWSSAPEKAYETLVYLNDKYELDGRDPNGYAGIAWCFGKHDRAWTERNIFGKIRFMNAKGLERKFNIKEYAEKWNRMSGGAGKKLRRISEKNRIFRGKKRGM
ncbi:MAG: deoxyribodipyrimidine photo-lyase [Candidatus Goldiibacteriota bacterium]